MDIVIIKLAQWNAAVLNLLLPFDLTGFGNAFINDSIQIVANNGSKMIILYIWILILLI